MWYGRLPHRAIEHMRDQVKTEDEERAIQEAFRGVEKKQLPHVLCVTNMLLHGIDESVASRATTTPSAAALHELGHKPTESTSC